MTCVNPEKPSERICKRLIALQGTAVAVPRFEAPSLFNGLRGRSGYSLMEIPRGHVWLQGDNVGLSNDSRSFGPVPYALITGRVWMQVTYQALLSCRSRVEVFVAATCTHSLTRPLSSGLAAVPHSIVPPIISPGGSFKVR